ncbi:hypothetical protein [Microbacterium sp.]|uniref:hypothetical protein n=1 Tax=Microbacterium sp. TaxID=51671 RepID=UPI0039E51907
MADNGYRSEWWSHKIMSVATPSLPSSMREIIGDRSYLELDLASSTAAAQRAFSNGGFSEPTARELNGLALALSVAGRAKLARSLCVAVVRRASSEPRMWYLGTDAQLNIVRLDVARDGARAPVVDSLRRLIVSGESSLAGNWHLRLPSSARHADARRLAAFRLQALVAYTDTIAQAHLRSGSHELLLDHALRSASDWPRALASGLTTPLEVLAHTNLRPPVPAYTTETVKARMTVLVDVQAAIHQASFDATRAGANLYAAGIAALKSQDAFAYRSTSQRIALTVATTLSDIQDSRGAELSLRALRMSGLENRPRLRNRLASLAGTHAGRVIPSQKRVDEPAVLDLISALNRPT